MPEKFEFAASFPRSDQLLTLLRHENGAFRKRFSSNRRNLTTSALHFSVDRKQVENDAFYKTSCCDNLIFPVKRILLKHKSKMTDH